VFILQLMQMVQENADVRLHRRRAQARRGAVVQAVPLHQFPGFRHRGRDRIAAPRGDHAGLHPAVPLAVGAAGHDQHQGLFPRLLQAAIVRGRFAELLGKDLLPRAEAEHLFFVGMFSLLDQLLGIPLQTVVSQILLPDAVVQALLNREGVFGPFLKLVEACEQPERPRGGTGRRP
jgi:hypothetical protein